ncbi:MAG: short-chain dehydrogenase, partial [Oxalobacteraceae bacterium]
MAHQDDVAAKQRAIQQEQDARDAKKNESESKEAVQTGVDQPAPPMPAQHLAKPGLEADVESKPKFMAEGYKGSGKLEG